jgi:hypothetical protein
VRLFGHRAPRRSSSARRACSPTPRAVGASPRITDRGAMPPSPRGFSTCRLSPSCLASRLVAAHSNSLLCSCSGSSGDRTRFNWEKIRTSASGWRPDQTSDASGPWSNRPDRTTPSRVRAMNAAAGNAIARPLPPGRPMNCEGPPILRLVFPVVPRTPASGQSMIGKPGDERQIVAAPRLDGRDNGGETWSVGAAPAGARWRVDFGFDNRLPMANRRRIEMGTDGRLDSRRWPIRGPSSMSRAADSDALRDNGGRCNGQEGCVLQPLLEITTHDH